MRNALAVLAVISLTACGGGGSSAPMQVAPDVQLTVSVQHAMMARESSGATQNFTLAGWEDLSTAANPGQIVNFTGSGTAVASPGVPTTASSGPLAGTKGVVATQTLTYNTVTANGTTPNSSTTSIAYSADNGSILATQSGGVTTYYPQYSYPTSAKAGSAGQLYRSTNLAASYAVSAGSANMLTYTETRDSYDNAGNHLSQAVLATSIGADGSTKAISTAMTTFSGGKAVYSMTITYQ